MKLTSVVIDGALFVTVSWFIFNQAYFGGDEAAKYLKPETKFWLNWVVGSIATMAGALKAFRSTTFSKHQDAQKVVSGSSETITKSETHSDATKEP